MIKQGILIFILLVSFLFSDTINVKYRGNVEVANGHFLHLKLKSSSLVKDIYYDKDNKYLLVKLTRTYYHYCSVPNNVVDNWRASPSLGKFYNTYIKGNYDCRIYPIPSY